MNAQKRLQVDVVRRPKVGITIPPLLVLLHGEGSNEKEIFDLFQKTDDRFVVASLRAPFVQENNKYLWYTTNKLGRDYLANTAQLEYSRQNILANINYIQSKFHSDPNQLYLFGFGQGGVLATNLLLTVHSMVSGVAILNSEFLLEFKALMPFDEDLKNKEIFICHGKYNQIVPIDHGRKIKYELSMLPLTVKYQEFEIGHYYSQEAIDTINNWLTNRLNDAKIYASVAPPDYPIRLIAFRINVGDIDRSINFYTQFLGMELIEITGKAYAFLSNSRIHHHIIELQLTEDKQKVDDSTLRGIQAVKFEVSDQLSFAKAYWNITEAGISVSAVDRIICWQMEFSDPDGNHIQIVWDTRHLPERSDVWYGRELPLEKERILEPLFKSLE